MTALIERQGMALAREPDEVDDKRDANPYKVAQHQAVKYGGCFTVEMDTPCAKDDELCKPGD